MIYVLYHGKCCDGFGAAYAAWKKLGDTAKYIPVRYNEELPQEVLDNKDLVTDVYCVDFSYSKESMLYWARFFNLIVIDHHKTAAANLVGLSHPKIKTIFDMNKSGARLAWEYFHPDSSYVPKLVLHIEDRDLWRFNMPGTKEIHMALVSRPFDFKAWDNLDVDDLIAEGASLLRMYSQLVEDICMGSWVGKIGEDSVPMVNTSIAWSEIGAALLSKYPDHKYVASFTEFEKETMWSLRCRPDFDCSEVAKKFGGGGHAQAAGFKVKK